MNRLTILMLLSFASQVSASAGHSQAFAPLVGQQPAQRYSGTSPIDLSVGLCGNNGVFGMPNASYPAWAENPAAVGISSKPYTFEERNRLFRGIGDKIQFLEAAIANWAQTSEITREEAKVYSKGAIEAIESKLSQLRSTLAETKSAGTSNWNSAQDKLRHTLYDALTAYHQLHNNVVR